jgi:type IX secretion system PorP/SprF family membrane protein
MSRIIILFILLFPIANNIAAQQLPIFTQYRDHYGIINPAIINSDYFTLDYNLSIGASARSQWAANPYSPHTQTLHAEYTNNRFIFGAHLMNDGTGHTNLTGINGRVGYLVTGNDPKLWGFSAALSGAAIQYRISADEVQFSKADDPLLGFQDKKTYPDVGAGLFGYVGGKQEGDMYYIGASVPQLLSTTIVFDNNNNKVALQRVPHFYGVLGMYKSISEDQSLEISLWARSVQGMPFSASTNLRLLHKDLFWVGAGVSTNRVVHTEMGFMVGDNIGLSQNYRISYSYDASFNTYAPYFGGAHEVSLMLMLDTNGGRYSGF